ncbi:MAG TPA: asparagine synthase (glutamine-hydrolyzing) [Abditibacteriaceae bacterium]|nr:asparagine synthase (glutamine-hydrolyzing) [Abditibacteriaceae bacterium]
MCGIVGAISTAPIDPNLIIEMRDRLTHRGPDHGGLWLSDKAHIGLGHRRLAIVDLNPQSNQPFFSHDGRFVITFNGEIYNFQSLREELVARGVPFHTRSDTEVLVEAFRCWGEQCLSRLSGMFAFAIWDTVEQRLFCARDRAGEKPFYYAMVNGSFIFASELKSLVVWPAFRKEIDYSALIDFLTFGFVPDPKSIWQDCRKLPPGHWMSVQTQSESTPIVGSPVAYWDMEFAPDGSVSDWGPQILETLQAASKEMAFADVPVGAFLSGGVDSSAVTAALSKAGCAVNTFTVGFQEQAYDERRWAREVAQLYQTTHVEKIVAAEDVVPVFQKILWHYDEPFNDYSYLPTYYLCREARKAITVALSGDGGDEVFAGYLKYQRLGMMQEVRRFTPRPVRRLLVAGANALQETHKLGRKALQYGMEAPAMLADMLTLGFSPTALRAAARGPLAEALRHYAPLDTVLPLLRKAPPEKVGLINSMRYLDLKLTLAGDILVKVDRASMAVSLEVRPVFLHRDLMNLAGRIPPGLLADGQHSKEALKSALRGWLPDSILYRKKMGFAMPLQSWISGDLRQVVTQGDGENPLDHLLDATLLETMSSTHAAGNANLTSRIHSLFFLQNWLGKWA